MGAKKTSGKAPAGSAKAPAKKAASKSAPAAKGAGKSAPAKGAAKSAPAAKSTPAKAARSAPTKGVSKSAPAKAASKSTPAKAAQAVGESAKAPAAEAKEPRSTAKDTKAPAAGVLRYALASARTSLGDGFENTTTVEEGDTVKFSCRGVHYASLRVDGNELVVHFLEPVAPAELAPKLKLYKPGPSKGWLEFRTVVARDPKPWLAASVGGMVGQTLFELLNGKRGK